MKNKIIKNYINSLTINQIKDFAFKNDIGLNENELLYIYKCIKNNWKELINNNPTNIFNNLKDNINYESYIKIIDLYYYYKNKYQDFL